MTAVTGAQHGHSRGSPWLLPQEGQARREQPASKRRHPEGEAMPSTALLAKTSMSDKDEILSECDQTRRQRELLPQLERVSPRLQHGEVRLLPQPRVKGQPDGLLNSYLQGTRAPGTRPNPARRTPSPQPCRAPQQAPLPCSAPRCHRAAWKPSHGHRLAPQKSVQLPHQPRQDLKAGLGSALAPMAAAYMQTRISLTAHRV